MGTGCGRGRHVPHSTASSTTSPSARPRAWDRWTSNRNGPNRAWSSHNPRLQNRQLPRAAFAQNQHNNENSYLARAEQARIELEAERVRLGLSAVLVVREDRHGDGPAPGVGLVEGDGELRPVEDVVPDAHRAGEGLAVRQYVGIGARQGRDGVARVRVGDGRVDPLVRQVLLAQADEAGRRLLSQRGPERAGAGDDRGGVRGRWPAGRLRSASLWL